MGLQLLVAQELWALAEDVGQEATREALEAIAAALASDASLRERVLRGFFSMPLNGQPQDSPTYRGYLARRQQLPRIGGDGLPCSSEVDDDGAPLWAQDHDNNASTALACANFDLSHDGPFDAFGYDAVFAVAHAVHDLVEVQNCTELVGS